MAITLLKEKLDKTSTPIADRPGWEHVKTSVKDGDKYYLAEYDRPATWEAFTELVKLTTKIDDQKGILSDFNYGLSLSVYASSKPAGEVETTIIKRKGQPDLDLTTLPIAPLCKAINGAMAAALIGRKPSGQMLYTRRVLLEQHKVIEKDGENLPVPTITTPDKSVSNKK